MVSVIIPCRNGAETLPDQLDALARQSYAGDWEVVLVDNGSTDGSAELAMDWAGRLTSVRVVRTDARGVSRVRNAGVRAARGDLVALCDADDVVVPGWLDAMVEAAAAADLVGGALDDTTLNTAESVVWRGLRPQGELLARLDHLPYAPGGNCAVWRDVFEALGGWDPAFVGGSDDVDFSWRAIGLGFHLAFAPEAVIQYRYRGSLWGLCRQYFRYGYTEAQLYQRYRADLPGHHWREVRRLWVRQLRTARSLTGGSLRAGPWLRDSSFHLGRLWGSVRLRVVLP
jgi:glycosyltransferase involved in cell wall biosynthesis